LSALFDSDPEKVLKVEDAGTVLRCIDDALKTFCANEHFMLLAQAKRILENSLDK
jgi:hypothetical protein